jgi:UDPglucose--hexose-1-phosphate uridylyltransferase
VNPLYQAIADLLEYSHIHQLLPEEEHDYAYNKLLDILEIEYQTLPSPMSDLPTEPSTLLQPLLDLAAIKSIFTPDTTKQRDIFEAKIMDILIERPQAIINHFNAYQSSTEKTDYYYHLSQKSNYIKTARTSKNIQWTSDTPYGEMQITINLSKPEKDPKDIIAQKHATTNNYPSCLLCKENVGYNGLSTGIGRTNHRIIPITLNNEAFYLQYSPYVYYNEHCIVLQKEHVPMNVTVATFRRLFDFVDQFPHYFLGSNAGLPIVGGSILSHEHYQGGRHHFPVEDARVLYKTTVKDVTIEQLYWPLSVIRLRSTNKQRIIDAAYQVYKYWEQYENKDLGIYKKTNNEPHNAITPIARKKDGVYELDMALRNNRTSLEYPLGIFHPHPTHHHIKKENIGLIEVIGLAILPARLQTELAMIKQVISDQSVIPQEVAHHAQWIQQLQHDYNNENIDRYLEQHVALKFTKVLEDAGVFKQTSEGKEAFTKLIQEVEHVLHQTL